MRFDQIRQEVESLLEPGDEGRQEVYAELDGVRLAVRSVSVELAGPDDAHLRPHVVLFQLELATDAWAPQSRSDA